MKAEIVSVGTELLLGEITDTNASYLASELPALGIDLYWISQVGDNQTRLEEILRRAWQRSDLILTTGGLGPTEDDLTREAIAGMLGERLRVDPDLERDIRELFTQRGIEMPPSNIKQATLIPSAEAIHNFRGTAPGWWVERDGRILVAMPGPPIELEPIWCEEVLPRLQRRCTGGIILSRTLKTFGLSEATVGEMVSPLLSQANPTLAVYAKTDGIHLRLTAKAPSQKQAEEILAQGEVSVRSILDKHIWGTDSDTLEVLIGHLLVEKGLSLAIMESGTGGLLSSTITDVPDSSAYFKGGLITDTDEAKIACGVEAKTIAEYGAISPEVAQAMAEVAKRHLRANIGIGVTGISPSEMKGGRMGTIYIGVDDGKSTKVTRSNYFGARVQMKRRATTAALIKIREIISALDW